MQILSIHLKNNSFKGINILGKEIKCCQLADDAAIFLKDELQVQKVLECLDDFSEMSGLCLNRKKCVLFPLRDDVSMTELGGIPVKDRVTYLGIDICKNQSDRVNNNFLPLIPKVKNRFTMWLMRDLSLKGRILLSKTEGLSRLVYLARILDVPKSVIREVDSTLIHFIWRNKPHYLKKQVLENPLESGGLNVLDFQSANIVCKISWIKEFIKNRNKLWYLIPNLIFQKVGGIEFLLQCNYNVDKLPIKLSNFHKQALTCWLLAYKHNSFTT